ncbi:hypothetical protein AB1N83_011208 [Pleurotus pulmonarius]
MAMHSFGSTSMSSKGAPWGITDPDLRLKVERSPRDTRRGCFRYPKYSLSPPASPCVSGANMDLGLPGVRRCPAQSDSASLKVTKPRRLLAQEVLSPVAKFIRESENNIANSTYHVACAGPNIYDVALHVTNVPYAPWKSLRLEHTLRLDFRASVPYMR